MVQSVSRIKAIEAEGTDLDIGPPVRADSTGALSEVNGLKIVRQGNFERERAVYLRGICVVELVLVGN